MMFCLDFPKHPSFVMWLSLNTLLCCVLQDVVGARDYFSRKIKFVTEQMEKIQKIASEKSKLREGGSWEFL